MSAFENEVVILLSVYACVQVIDLVFRLYVYLKGKIEDDKKRAMFVNMIMSDDKPQGDEHKHSEKKGDKKK